MDTPEAKKLAWLRILTGCVAAILVLMLVLTVSMFRTLRSIQQFEGRVDKILTRVETVSAQLEELDVEKMVATVNGVARELEASDITETLQSLQKVAGDLKEVDWAALAERADETMTQAKSSLEVTEEALRSVQAAVEVLDVEGLSGAIQDLKAAIEPLTALGKLLR
ncbi:MAG: hypothetical protein IJH47_09615 [Oscillospiraceae bacterium]|nr:hypothetical protein [Oscillospiraceae bacterium]